MYTCDVWCVVCVLSKVEIKRLEAKLCAVTSELSRVSDALLVSLAKNDQITLAKEQTHEGPENQQSGLVHELRQEISNLYLKLKFAQEGGKNTHIFRPPSSAASESVDSKDSGEAMELDEEASEGSENLGEMSVENGGTLSESEMVHIKQMTALKDKEYVLYAYIYISTESISPSLMF